MKLAKISIICFLLITLSYGCIDPNKSSSSISESSSITISSSKVEIDVDKLIEEMTLDAKIGQMIQSERNASDAHTTRVNHVGGIFIGGGRSPGRDAKAWITSINNHQNLSMKSTYKIPLLYGTDGVHGNGNFDGATLFPHNIGLGAANNPELMYKIGEITAKEMRVLGINMNFAPAIAAAQDARWGRYYESYSENPEIVDRLSLPYIKAMQENNVVATAKHYILDGATTWDNNYNQPYGQIDKTNANMSMEELREFYLPSYKKAVDEGVKAIMVYFNSVNGKKMHEHEYLITDVLKGELGFEGIVVSDYNAYFQLSGTYKERLAKAINAGVDLFLFDSEFADGVRQSVVSTIKTIKEAVKDGLVSEERINDAARRIIKVKYDMGFFDNYLTNEEDAVIIASKQAKDVARQAVRESLVLLKNQNDVLPLSKDQNILLIGPVSDNLGYQNGGWSISWQGESNSNRFYGTTLLSAFEEVSNGNIYTDINDASKADVVVVAIGEKPYAEHLGDNKELTLDSRTAILGNDYTSDNMKALKAAYETGLPVVVILVSGRPLLVNYELPKWDAFVMAWLYGNESLGITDVLYGDYDFKGKLPVTWPRTVEQFDDSVINPNYNPDIYQFPFGYGLTYNNN